MSTPPIADRQPSRLRSALGWIARRWEVLIPLLGILMFRGMMGSSDGRPPTWQTGVVLGIAIVYSAIVLWRPMDVPKKAPAHLDRASVVRAAKGVVPVVVVGVAISIVIRAVEGQSSGGAGLWGLLSVMLIAVLGTVGLAAEHRLPVDLLPVLRRREWLRIIYVLAAAFSLAMVGQLGGGIAKDICHDGRLHGADLSLPRVRGGGPGARPWGLDRDHDHLIDAWLGEVPGTSEAPGTLTLYVI